MFDRRMETRYGTFRIHLILFGALFLPTALFGQDGRFVSACLDEQLVLGVSLTDSVQVDTEATFEVPPLEPGRRAYGQMFFVQRAWPDLASDTVILVKWNTGVQTRVPRALGPGRWIEEGERKMVQGSLREQDHWAGGIPTIDVLAWSYPGRSHFSSDQAFSSPEVMTADEFFEFCSMRVDLGLVEAGDWSRDIEPVVWAKGSEGAWRKPPAPRYLRLWAQYIEHSRIQRAPVEVGGTYAATVTLPSGRNLTAFFRTSENVVGSWDRGSGQRNGKEALPWEIRFDGYRLPVWWALDRESLPEVQGDTTALPCRKMLEVRRMGDPQRQVDPSCLAAWPWKVGLADPDTGPKKGHLELELISSLLADDREIGSFFDTRSSFLLSPLGRSHAFEKDDRGDFSLTEDGSLQYRQTVSLYTGETLIFTAVRASPEIVRVVSR